MRFLVVLLLGGCAILQSDRERCAELVDSAWKELDISKTEGFAALVSYARAATLIADAKLEQTNERFPACIASADKARFYIKESRAGR